jgi:hypothetical protein
MERVSVFDGTKDRILKAMNIFTRHVEVCAWIPILTGNRVVVENLSVRIVKGSF